MITLKTIQQYILDILFPIHCLGCDREGEWLCGQCYKKIRLNTQQVCPVCRRPGTGKVCPGCKMNTALDGLLVTSDYEQLIVKNLIHTLKYLSIPSLAQPLASLTWQCLNQFKTNEWPSILRNKYTVITPVPLHNRKLRTRGFNQSKLIANELASLMRLTVVNLLIRTRHTKSQMSLDRHERLKNVIGAFSIRSEFEKMPENVIIIDDVATTLATLHECASVLKSHGVTTVWGIVVARGS
jgi:ComF family protein